MNGPNYTDNDVIYWGSTSWNSHRDKGPCYIEEDGHLIFLIDAERNYTRKKGPSYITPDGSISYYKCDSCRLDTLHRTDGPALIHDNGDKEYWVDGDIVTPLEFFATYGVL